MEAKIKEEIGDKSPSEITELNLDNVRTSTIAGLTDEFSNLVKLSMVNVGLTSLENFPKLSKLEQVELGDNKLSEGLEHLHGCPIITTLSLVGNRISSVDQLKPLAKLEKLKNVDLFGCPVTNQLEYRDQVFQLLPNLHLLDGMDREGKEGQESSDEEEEDYEDDDNDEDDDDVGLSYLQKELGDSDESEQDYDPDEEVVEEEEDEPSDEEDSDDDNQHGQSSSGVKRRRVMPPQEADQSSSD